MLRKNWSYIKRRWFSYLVAYSAKIAIRILLKTCSVKIHGLKTFVTTAEKLPCMLVLWHNRLVLVPEILNTYASQFIYTAFISKSRDGDPLAFLAKSYASGRALRVPHNARHLALAQMIETLKNKKEIIIITPDGPRGPRYVVKPGVALAARETGANIIPFSWHAKCFWQLKTWDQIMIPKPFTTVNIVFGEPIVLSKENQGEYENEVVFLKNSLDSFDRLFKPDLYPKS